MRVFFYGQCVDAYGVGGFNFIESAWFLNGVICGMIVAVS